MTLSRLSILLRPKRTAGLNTQIACKECLKTWIRAASGGVSMKFHEHKSLEKIRNIGISAHIDSGKTTVTERILYYSGRIDEMHEVRGKDRIGATMDFMDLERERGITIQSAATFLDWKGTSINVIDTPGHVDFTIEVERALRVLDGAILVVCGVAGVQSQTYTVNRQMTRYNVPFLTFINKLDRQMASVERALEGLRKKLGHNAALIQLPIGKESKFCGVVDIINDKAIYFLEPDGYALREDEVPVEMRAQVSDAKAELIEHLSNADEKLGEMFLEERHPTTEDLKAAIRRTVHKRTFLPVLVGSALKNKGIQPLLDAVVSYLPHPGEVENWANVLPEKIPKDTTPEPEKYLLKSVRDSSEPFVGMAFKLEGGKFGQLTYFRIYQGKFSKGDTVHSTRDGRKVKIQRLVRMHADEMEDIDVAYAGDICATFGLDCHSGDTFTSESNWNIHLENIYVPPPVVSMSMKPLKGDTDNFMKALTRFTKEDPTFQRSYDPELKETIVSGMGELHLEIYGQRMKSEYKCPVELGKPKVAFRECLAKPCKFHHYHKLQRGGQGQYGKVQGIVEPLPPEQNTEIEIVDESIGTGIPKPLIPALKKGFMEVMANGPLIGYKVAGVKVRIQDGAHHEVDSTEIAFINTGKGAMRDVYVDGKWILMEPIMLVEVTGPVEFQAAVMSLVGKRDGIFTSTESFEDYFVIQAEAPLNQMFGFASDLRANTEGKGDYSMEFKRYAPMSTALQSEAIQRITKQQEDEELQEQKMKKAKKRA